jgi:hypothetical protein
MKSALWVAILAIGGVCLTAARAEPPKPVYDGCKWFKPKLCEEWRSRACWCPDDYCAKCLPKVPPNPKGCCDDYCPKTPPCVPPNPKGCCDDYTPRCCPLWIGPLVLPWYTCGPKEDFVPEQCKRPKEKCFGK